MRRFSFKVIVSLTTFFFGVLVVTFFLVSEKPKEIQLVQPKVTKTEATPEPKPTQTFPQTLPSFDKKTISPYEIEKFINANPNNEVQEIWEKLKIPKIYHGTPIHSDTDGFFFDTCNACKAKTFNLELDEQPDSEVLLKIEDPWRENCRYLLFKHKPKNKWQLLGYIDHDFGKYEMPKHSILRSSGKNWLIVRVQMGSGSGFSLYYDRLFAVINNKLIEILEYPVDGHQSNLGLPASEISAHIVDCKIENNTAIVKVDFSINYSTYSDTNDDIGLWSKKQTAVFRKNFNYKKVIFDNKHSNLSKGEMKAIYEYDESSTNEDLVKYNFEELKKISLGKNSIKKEWLQRFLELCKSTRQTKILQRNLKK